MKYEGICWMHRMKTSTLEYTQSVNQWAYRKQDYEKIQIWKNVFLRKIRRLRQTKYSKFAKFRFNQKNSNFFLKKIMVKCIKIRRQEQQQKYSKQGIIKNVSIILLKLSINCGSDENK